MEELKFLQIEITNKCNLNCKYCLRNFWSFEKPGFIDLKALKEIIFKYDTQKYVLYGFGEPFFHPEIREILEFVCERGEVLLITNGTLKEVELYGEMVHYLGFSADTFDMKNPMRFVKTEEVLKRAEALSKKTKVFLSVVVFKDNLQELPEVVRWAGERGIDVFVSHLVPYTKKMASQSLFAEVSEAVFKKCKEMLKTVEEAKRVLYLVQKFSQEGVKIYKKIIKAIGDYHLNLKGVVSAWEREALLNQTADIFESCREIARAYGMRLALPRIFADEKQRSCPYENALFIRADLKVSPCAEFAYSHRLFVNDREKEVRAVISPSLEFQNKKRRLTHYYPWCGDCQLTNGCWFLEEGMDCYGNQPSCSECLFSAGIARCVVWDYVKASSSCNKNTCFS